jgi:Zinc carboxypeptidase
MAAFWVLAGLLLALVFFPGADSLESQENRQSQEEVWAVVAPRENADEPLELVLAGQFASVLRRAPHPSNFLFSPDSKDATREAFSSFWRFPERSRSVAVVAATDDQIARLRSGEFRERYRVAELSRCPGSSSLDPSVSCGFGGPDDPDGGARRSPAKHEQRRQQPPVFFPPTPAPAVPRYHSTSEASAFLDQVVAVCGAKARKFSLGKSVQGRDLWALRISRDLEASPAASGAPGSFPETARPEFKFVGPVHGDEAVGREMVLYFASFLCSNYVDSASSSTPPTALQAAVTDFVDTTDIVLVVSSNPDGYESVRRTNAYGIDLNRNFPDIRFPSRTTGFVFFVLATQCFSPSRASNVLVSRFPSFSLPRDLTQGGDLLIIFFYSFFSSYYFPGSLQQETRLLMALGQASSFVLSATFHGGAVVASYPFDGDQSSRRIINPTPDHAFVVSSALAYSRGHTTMHKSTEFANGITNGAQWYSLFGGYQDWGYLTAGCIDVTMEISNIKHPAANQLPGYWLQNQAAMFKFARRVHLGVRGVVTNSTGHALRAVVRIDDNSVATYSDPDVGDYYRLVLPGAYTLKISCSGYLTQSLTVVVPAQQRPRASDAVVRDIVLQRAA